MKTPRISQSMPRRRLMRTKAKRKLMARRYALSPEDRSFLCRGYRNDGVIGSQKITLRDLDKIQPGRWLLWRWGGVGIYPMIFLGWEEADLACLANWHRNETLVPSNRFLAEMAFYHKSLDEQYEDGVFIDQPKETPK